MFIRQYRFPLVILVALTAGLFSPAPVARAESAMTTSVPENVYRGALVSYPGPWSFQIGKSSIILVSDEELKILANPDKKFNMAMGRNPNMVSLREICERAKARGQRTLIIAFDHFFSQYRPKQKDKPRRLMPDDDAYIRRIAAISKFAQGYGLGLELSLLSPLEIGKAYQTRTGESGIWMHYRKGVRDPKTGAFSVQLWRQLRWANNKGPINIQNAGVRVFAFKEKTISSTPYRAVDPDSIVELKHGIHVQRYKNLMTHAGDYEAVRIRVHGRCRTKQEGLNRVLVVQLYRTPEMDYFSPKALPFLKHLIDKYVAAGVKLNGLYSDEMHIQQDWAYFNHHDHGEFALRYVSPGLAARYAQLYGAQYKDFAKYLVYFVHGQEDTVNDLTAKEGVMETMGSSPEDIQRTALFRARYYHLLQDGVVNLFVAAKHYAEQKMGHTLEARAHATWAESPTIDYWNVGRQPHAPNQYEYTPNFVWSNTVQQASAACYDYFKWGDFLTGNGNDYAEGGWSDRDYYALAMACSTGILNKVPYSYAAHWGMPAAISRRRMALVDVYGDAGEPQYGIVQDMQHRDTSVLMLYPLDLVAVEERFGSWMTQYGYTDYVTQAKLLERGTVNGAGIDMAGRRFTTLVAMFEPFPSQKLLNMMKAMGENGGRVIWSGPPPLLTLEGNPALKTWESIFDVHYKPGPAEGLIAPDKQITFEGRLAGVAPQIIPTSFLVDRIYPITVQDGATAAAKVKAWTVAASRTLPNGGSFTFLGYRPRDDQSQSLGYDTRNWFEVLNTLGAYPPTGRFKGINDNTDYLSRTGDYLTCRFPNGAVAIAPHFRTLDEDWPGGFSRNLKQDAAIVKRLTLPTEVLALNNYHVNGHTVTYQGKHAMCFRVDGHGDLLGFAGRNCRRVTIDGRPFIFADHNLGQICWAPVPQVRRVTNGAVVQLMVSGRGAVRIPAVGLPPDAELVAEGPTPGSRGKTIPSHCVKGALVFTITPAISNRWLYVVPSNRAK